MDRTKSIRVPGKVEQVLDGALDKALAIQRGAVTGYVDKVRRDNPHASPAQVVDMLSSRYKKAVIAIGAAAGGAAAVPGVGTAASLASGAVEIGAFVDATALYALAVADVYGISISDPERRRVLVMAILVGDDKPLALEGGALATSPAWGAVLARTVPREKIGGIRKRLARRMITRFGTRQGALLFGRAFPMGIGAGIGAWGNAKLADGAIATTRRAFGPPPPQFGPRVITV